MPRPYVTARVNDQVFHLLDGQEVHIDPYYVFLARSNQQLNAALGAPGAIHSAGHLDALKKELIIDAARQLASVTTRLL